MPVVHLYSTSQSGEQGLEGKLVKQVFPVYLNGGKAVKFVDKVKGETILRSINANH